MNNSLVFLSSFFLGVFFINFFRKLSLKFNILKSDKGIPVVGGLGAVIPFFICYFLFKHLMVGAIVPIQFLWIIIFSLVLFIIEFIDDLKDFSLKTRVIIQIVFIFLVLSKIKGIDIYFLPQWINYILSFLWIMGITNAFNHLDIGDGQCGGISLIISLAFLIVSILIGNILMSILFLCICGVMSAFLLFNLPPARIFMGNSGSHFFGFLFAVLSMYGDYASLEKPIVLILPLLVLGFPLIDTLFLIIIRIKKGVMPLKKSDDHILLSLVSSGRSIKESLCRIYIVTLLWCLSGVFLLFNTNIFFILFLLLALIFTFRLIYKVLPSQ